MYSYENYHKVKDGIEKRRRDALAAAEARELYVRSQSPDIERIDSELSKTGLELFRIACTGGDLEPLKKRNRQLVEERKRLLVRLGYPADYTEVKYSCPDCSDTGYIKNGAAMCHCFREALIKENIASSGIGRLIEKQSFDNFDLNWYKSNGDTYARMSNNLAAAKDYVRDFGNGQNLLLIGKTGTGKTHISTAIARELIHKGYDVVYDSAQNIVSDFEADKFRSGYSQQESRSEKYLVCDLLIMDDLGTEFLNQFTVSCIYNLLNTRQNRGFSTIISTNLSPEELAHRYEDRIYSRMVGRGTQILFFAGDDHRIG